MKKFLTILLRLLRIKLNKTSDFLSEYISVKEEINDFLLNFSKSLEKLNNISVKLLSRNEEIDLLVKEQLFNLSRISTGITLALKQEKEQEAKKLITRKFEIENQLKVYQDRKAAVANHIEIVDKNISDTKIKIQTLTTELETLEFEYEQATLNKELNSLLYTSSGVTSTLKSIKERVRKTKAEDAGLQAHIEKHEKDPLDSNFDKLSQTSFDVDQEYQRLYALNKKDVK